MTRYERRQRWMAWFIDAGWTANEVAHLFDTRPGHVINAVRRR